MKENKGTIKIEDKIKDRLDIIIIETVKYWGASGIRKYALIDEVERISSIVLPDKKGKETIRKKIDRLVKSGVLIREGGWKRAIIRINPEIMIDETIKPFAEEVRKTIRLQREEKLVVSELRIKHTENIKRKIIEPLLLLLNEIEQKIDDPDRLRESFESIKALTSKPLYKDLVENHFPNKIEGEIEKLLRELEKLTKLSSELLLNFKLWSAEKQKGRKLEFLEALESIRPDIERSLELCESVSQRIKLIRDELEEIEAYECFPGICKYLRGD